MPYIERAFQDAREGRPAPRPFSDGVIPTAFDKTLCPEGNHIMSLFTQWVPVGLERRAAHRGTAGLRRPHDRLLQRGGAELQELDPARRHRRPVRDGARLRPDRRQHLPRRAVPGAAVPHAPRARFRRLPHPGARPVLRQLRHPRAAAASAASPACRRPRPRSPTAAPPSVAPPQAIRRARHGDRARPQRPSPRCWRRAASRWSGPAPARAASARGWSRKWPGARPAPRTYLVNPRYADIDGAPCLPRLADVPEPVDLVLLGGPRHRAGGAAGAAARAGRPFGRDLRQRL